MASERKSMHLVATADRPMTYRDLARLPDDGLRHEVLDGEHVVTPSPGTGHQAEYWMVDPATQEVTALRRAAPNEGFTPAIALIHARRETLTSPLFPGLRIPLGRIFR